MSYVAQSKIRIADIVFAFAGLTSDWVWKHKRAFEGFRSRGSPDVVLRLHCGCPPPPPLAAEMVRSVAGARNIYLSQDRWLFEFNPRDRIIVPERPPRQLLIFDRRFTMGDLYVSTDFPSERPVLNLSLFLLEFMAAMLPSYDGMMVHASGISDGARGIVFAGPAGAGKSTMTHLWQECDRVRVLNDDRIILRKKGGQWWAYPMLGVGEPRSGSSEGVPLEAVFLIFHADENVVRRMNSSAGARSLLAHLSLPAHDAAATRATLHLLDDLLHQAPVYELGFCPEEAIVGFVRDVVRRGEAPGGVTGQHVVALETTDELSG